MCIHNTDDIILNSPHCMLTLVASAVASSGWPCAAKPHCCRGLRYNTSTACMRHSCKPFRFVILVLPACHAGLKICKLVVINFSSVLHFKIENAMPAEFIKVLFFYDHKVTRDTKVVDLNFQIWIQFVSNSRSNIRQIAA